MPERKDPDSIPPGPFEVAEIPFRTAAVALNPTDNVAVLKRPLKPGDELTGAPSTLVIQRAIGAGHKVALREIPDGDPVRKYGQIIGFAQGVISPGEHVHTHNVALREFDREYRFCAEVPAVRYYPPGEMRFFQGYARPDGRVGTRNYVAVISSVNCSASVCRFVQEAFHGPQFRRDFPNVDGVVAFTHKSGCGIDPGEPQQVLQRVLAGMALHPNVGGYVMIGLGCEVNQLDVLRKAQGLEPARSEPMPPLFLNVQAAGGLRKTVDTAIAATADLLRLANECRRTPQPVSKLILAENCGGSDANSGITANPALGIAADELVRYGGTVVLAETPEIYGAEHLLVRRAVSREVAERLLERIKWWERHMRQHNSSIDNNPSPGNKAGGLTNIFEKSLGAVAKGGHSPLAAVYQYAERITSSGLCFMDTPGFDPVSMTGLAAGGCNIAVFTTGRGSVYGCKPTPCIKVASNSPLFEWMKDDMDINAGTILEGSETVRDVGIRLFDQIVAVAGGEKTKSEWTGIGDEEFAPWQLGPTL